jgi:hypothetical protein
MSFAVGGQPSSVSRSGQRLRNTLAVRDKILGGKQQAQQVGEKRAEIRELISSELLQEIMLK